MKYLKGKLKLHMSRLAAIAAVFGVSWLVLAYFLGYYDLSFLDRSDILGEMLDDPTPTETDAPPAVIPETNAAPAETDASDKVPGEPKETDAPTAETPEKTESVVGIYNTDALPDVTAKLPLVSELTDFTAADGAYRATETVLAKMQFGFKLPSDFSIGERRVRELSYVELSGNAPYVASYTMVTEARPAVEVYMGMIFIDVGDSLVLVDGEGTPLCSFDGTVYKPAYTRDRDGRPLFVKEADGGAKTYFYLSEDGRNFIRSDYNDSTDNRGLYFDYPADWGTSDSGTIFREYSAETGRWAYRTEYSYVTSHSYTQAYDFTEGVACVVSNQNRGGMYFIGEYGWPTHQTFVTFLSDLDRHFIWDYALPASRGIENIGFFYFDHGLTRVRYQVIDYYNWTKGRVYVISDEDKLIRTDGTFFDLPHGYTLKGYSEGMILLEKDGIWGIMDYTGGWIAEPCYASATPFVDGLAVLETADGRFGMIDTEGNIVLPFAYDNISMASSGLVAVYRAENGWSVLKLMEKTN